MSQVCVICGKPHADGKYFGCGRSPGHPLADRNSHLWYSLDCMRQTQRLEIIIEEQRRKYTTVLPNSFAPDFSTSCVTIDMLRPSNQVT
jgi:hypothetical protein